MGAKRKTRVDIKVPSPEQARAVRVPGGSTPEEIAMPKTFRALFDAYFISERFQRKSAASRERQISNIALLVRDYGHRPFGALATGVVKGFCYGAHCNPKGAPKVNTAEPVGHKATVIRELCRFSRDIGADHIDELMRVYAATDAQGHLGWQRSRAGIQPVFAIRPPELEQQAPPAPELKAVVNVDPPRDANDVARRQLRSLRGQLVAMQSQIVSAIDAVDALGLEVCGPRANGGD
jgi:hypothetical protein